MTKKAAEVAAFENVLLAERVAARHVEGTDFSSPEALRQYLKDHPGADPKKHHVVKEDASGKEDRHSGLVKTKIKPPRDLGAEISKAWTGPSGNALNGLGKMISDGKEVTLGHVNKAMQVVNQALLNAKGDDAKALRGVKTKLKNLMQVKD